MRVIEPMMMKEREDNVGALIKWEGKEIEHTYIYLTL